MKNIIIRKTPQKTAEVLFNHIVIAAEESIAERGVFHLMFPGGLTPVVLFCLIAEIENKNKIDWLRTHIYWTDERVVPYNNPDSNYNMAFKMMISHINIPVNNIHRLPTEHDDLETAMNVYEEQVFKTGINTQLTMPRFDMIILGLGEDGHTASLFSDSNALNETKKWVIPVFVEKLNCWRLTTTLPVLNSARNICVFVTGDNKASIVENALIDDDMSLPINMVRPMEGKLYWYLDEQAGLNIPDSFSISHALQ